MSKEASASIRTMKIFCVEKSRVRNYNESHPGKEDVFSGG